jgi:predicted alpha/beta superfamily hydrolase
MFGELKPAVDALYRTKTGPDDTGIMGSSLGGLAAIHMGFKHPDKVHRICALSPSLWWNNNETLTLVTTTTSKPPLKIWLDIGTNEGSTAAASQQTVQDTRDVKSALQTLGFTLGQDLGYEEAQGAQHNEAAWQARLPDVLRFQFP